MNQSINSKILISSLVFNLLLVGFVIYIGLKEDKIGYIKLQQVFEQFEYKKEMELKLKAVQQERQKILDSLEFNLRLLAKQIESSEVQDRSEILLFETRKEELYKQQQQFEEDNTALIKKYDNQIIGQLNQYVSDFGKMNNYRYVLGNDGNGNIMYAVETDNITEQVIQFINNKYKGVN